MEHAIEVGTPVRYWPGLRTGPGTVSRTRSEVWRIGDVSVVSVEGYPGGICNHTVELKKPWQTIASVIYDLDAKRAWICYGPPCQGEYKEFQL